MLVEAKEVLAALKTLDFSSVTVNFWVIKRYLRDGDAYYQAFHMETEGFETIYPRVLQQQLERYETAQEYQAISIDNDDEGYLVARCEETDFNAIKAELVKGSDNGKISDLEDLKRSWGYVFEFDKEGKKIYAFNKIKFGWNVKKIGGIINALFKDGRFTNVTDGNVFPLSNSFDFIETNNFLFISSKKNFETALNIRDGLIKKRNEALEAFAALGITGPSEDMVCLVNNNKHLMRKLAVAQDNQYYKDPEFLNQMELVIGENGWGIERKEGVFILDEDNIETFLTLINNGRLKSMINHEVFDAPVKIRVSIP